ncbi:hypothetical protein F4802DRAFT_618652 [Xylaria palmicola]|nr:hypothetical protein F4802DRAFT_618652 [Xylaria palmicola]
MADRGSFDKLDGASIASGIPTSLTYRPFPPVMKVYYQWNLAGLTTYYVCGADQRDRLFAVKLHTGYSATGPLGARQGLHLHNGPTTTAPLLAAAGDDSLFRRSPNNNSRIFLPSPETGGLAEETMRAHVTPDKHVAFAFAIEVGVGGDVDRARFEWRNIEKSERDESTENGGFKLFHMAPEREQSTSGGESGGRGAATSSAVTAQDDAVVAALEWRRFLTSPKHPFDLRLVGDGVDGGFGNRWTLMVLTTALRLWELHQRGKTQRAPVAMAGLVGPREKKLVR